MIENTSNNNLLRIVISSPLRRSFDYLPPLDCDVKRLKLGIRVRVPFGFRKEIGILVEKNVSSTIDPAKLKRVLEIIDEEPLLPESIWSLCTFASKYYHHPLGDVLLNALPKLLRAGKATPQHSEKQSERATSQSHQHVSLNTAQDTAVTSILENLNQHKIFLLDGVTGSGKTEVYLRVIEKVIQDGKQALVLVPEIGLTPQTVARFTERFPKCNIAVFHSKLTDKSRLEAWWSAREGLADIIIGTRSALFTPLQNPGVIVLDEEHDLSFKQQSGLRYSARDLSVILSKHANIPLILGSATPSFESLYNAERKRYVYLSLPDRAGESIAPKFHLVDIRKQRLKGGLALNVIHNMGEHLAKGGQILLFINRRGYAPSLICHNCGWVAGCAKCDARLTLHQNPPTLCCHHCGSISKVPEKCPSCHNQELVASGLGTERVEIGVKKLFPQFQITRIDSDTTSKKGSMQNILQGISEGHSKILIGTQMLTKGHHFPDVTMVVILNADSGLFSADFRASEYLAQLIIQVAGRAGRATKPGEVYIQTHNPEHPLLLNLVKNGYQGFTKTSMVERRAADLPPFAHLAMFRSVSKNKELAHEILQKLRDYGKSQADKTVHLLGPIAATIERKANQYHAQLLLQSTNRTALSNMIESLIQYAETLPIAKRAKWSIDVDPVEIL